MPWLMVSGWGVSATSLARLAKGSDQCVEWHQAQPPTQPSWVFGWSLGGVVASDWLEHPNVLGLVTLGTPGQFSAQVNASLVKRLSRRVSRDPDTALQGFFDWLLPTARGAWQQPLSLQDGLDRLIHSECRDRWDQSDKPQLHLRGVDDPLFTSEFHKAIPGDHQIPFVYPVALRHQLETFAREV